MPRFILKICLLVCALALPGAAMAAPTAFSPILVRAAYFHADWCGNCRQIQPILQQAKKDAQALPIQHLTLDFSNAKTWDAAMETALENNIVSMYNGYAGTTGMVVLIAADTGERIGCLNRMFDAAAMVKVFEAAIKRVNTTPPGSRDAGSALCPAMRTRR